MRELLTSSFFSNSSGRPPGKPPGMPGKPPGIPPGKPPEPGFVPPPCPGRGKPPEPPEPGNPPEPPGIPGNPPGIPGKPPLLSLGEVSLLATSTGWSSNRRNSRTSFGATVLVKSACSALASASEGQCIALRY